MTVWYDPPSGWKYGFPKAYKPLKGETLEQTLLRDGYPQHELDWGAAKHCRFIGDKKEVEMQDTKGWARRMASLDEKEKKPEPEIIIIRESILQSLVSDAVTFITVVGVIGVGWFLTSSAMELAGFALLTFLLIAKTTGKAKRLTIAQARLRLDEIEKQ